MNKKNLGILGVAIVLVGVVMALVFMYANGEYAYHTVERGDIEQSVNLAGRVQSANAADLGFEVTGRVASIPVRVGVNVEQGDLLVALDTSVLQSELVDAQSLVAIKQSEFQNTEVNLEKIREQQDILVESARRVVNSDDLVAVPRLDDDTALSPPIISGTYRGEPGRYKIEIEKKNAHDTFYTLEVFGIERVDGKIEEGIPRALGTQGLFIEIPDDIALYEDTIWYIDVPNIRGVRYTANVNAYEQALQNRDVALQEARQRLDVSSQGGSIAQAELTQARARVDKIENQITQRRIEAPFAGTVSEVSVELGETVGVGDVVVTLVSDGGFEVRLDVPEIDISHIDLGARGIITLDAFGDSVIWNGTITDISRGETYVDGVPVYESLMSFEAYDERVRSGLSAVVTLITDQRDNVIRIPQEYLEEDAQGVYVLVSPEEGVYEKRYVETGLIGTNGMVEVVDGVSVGEVIAVAL